MRVNHQVGCILGLVINPSLGNVLVFLINLISLWPQFSIANMSCPSHWIGHFFHIPPVYWESILVLIILRSLFLWYCQTKVAVNCRNVVDLVWQWIFESILIILWILNPELKLNIFYFVVLMMILHSSQRLFMLKALFGVL